MKLRLVRRKTPKTRNGDAMMQETLVLQQWWQGSSMGTINIGFGGDMPLGAVSGECRDVPIEAEA